MLAKFVATGAGLLSYAGARVGLFGRNTVELRDTSGCTSSISYRHVKRCVQCAPLMDRVTYQEVVTDSNVNESTTAHNIHSLRPTDVSYYSSSGTLNYTSRGLNYREWLSK